MRHPGPVMARAARVFGVLAGLLLVAALLLAYLPNAGETLVDFRPPGTEIYGEVDCGSPFRSTRYSHDDGCEGPFLAQWSIVFLAGLGSIAFAAVGIGLWVASQRPGRPS